MTYISALTRASQRMASREWQLTRRETLRQCIACTYPEKGASRLLDMKGGQGRLSTPPFSYFFFRKKEKKIGQREKKKRKKAPSPVVKPRFPQSIMLYSIPHVAMSDSSAVFIFAFSFSSVGLQFFDAPVVCKDCSVAVCSGAMGLLCLLVVVVALFRSSCLLPITEQVMGCECGCYPKGFFFCESRLFLMWCTGYTRSGMQAQPLVSLGATQLLTTRGM